MDVYVFHQFNHQNPRNPNEVCTTIYHLYHEKSKITILVHFLIELETLTYNFFYYQKYFSNQLLVRKQIMLQSFNYNLTNNELNLLIL